MDTALSDASGSDTNSTPQAAAASTAPTPAEIDIWRDSPLRYVGYANEAGEAFRPLLPRLVGPSYALAFAYVLGDTWDKAAAARNAAPPTPTGDTVEAHAQTDTHASKESANANTTGSKQPPMKMQMKMQVERSPLVAGVDCLVWQTLASVAVPGLVIKAVTAGAVKALAAAPHNVARFGPTAAGLATVPFIIHPIDSAVDAVMDSTVRKMY